MIIEAISATIFLVFLYKSTRIPAGMPPGSAGLPLFGYLPQSYVRISQNLQNLKDKYGGIFTVKVGTAPFVFLADHQVIQRAFAHPDVQGRVEHYSFQVLKSFRNGGIVNAHGSVWKKNRRFMIQHLKDMGMGKSHIELSIMQEIEMLVTHLKENSLDHPTALDKNLNVAMVNITWQMLAGKRFDANDEEITKYTSKVGEILEIVQGPIILLDPLPWLRHLPRSLLNKWTRISDLENCRDIFQYFCAKLVEEHKQSLDPQNPKDIIDHFLLASKNDPTFTDSPDEDDMDLFILIADMFAAGSETTSTTLRWMILYMAMNKEVQAKAQNVIDEAIPHRERLPSLDDKNRMTYVDAVVLEVLRLSSHTPIGLPHCTTADVHLEGYFVPKGTCVVACLELCQKDPMHWEKPHEFYPEHFLDKEGKLHSKQDEFLPFSSGRRQCLGESLARMALFLFTAAILQQFTIEADPGAVLSAEPDPQKIVLNYPRPFKVILKKRN